MGADCVFFSLFRTAIVDVCLVSRSASFGKWQQRQEEPKPSLFYVIFIFSPPTVHRPLSTPEQMEREVALRQKIEQLKRNKAAMCLPKSSSAVENETAPKTRGTTAKDRSWGPEGKKEKTSLLYEFISVRVGPSSLSIDSNNTSQQQMTLVKVTHYIKLSIQLFSERNVY